MAPKFTDKLDDQPNGNGWTRYQQLVLNELQRHQDKLDSLENEITSLRLANVRLELEIKSNTDTLNKVLAELKQMEKLANEKAADLNLVKWKLGAWATGIAAIFGAIIQGVVKFFLHM